MCPVLDAPWQAVERPAIGAAGDLALRLAGRFQSTGLVNRNSGVQNIVISGDTIEAGAREFDRRDRPPPDQVGLSKGGQHC
jgi:hypothetical protein